MKMTLHAALIAGLLSCSAAFAQTGVPSEMSYQATVTDDVGSLLAPTSATSYEVIMRIYDSATGGSLLWSEQQVTEIFQGKFSIIMGQGIPVPIVGGNEPRPDLATVFGGSERFTELTVRENSPGKLPKTLAPRQKLVATATALRARLAEGLVNGAVISNGAISGTKLTDATLTGSKLENSTITSTQIRNSTITGSKIANFTIKATNIDDSAITQSKIANSAISDSKVATGINPSKLSPGSVNSFEFGHLNGVTSPIQTQINSKATLSANNTFLGSNTFGGTTTTGKANIGGSPFESSQLSVKSAAGVNSAIFQRTGTANGQASHIHFGANGDWFIRSAASGGRVVLQDTGGNVGIGTGSPTQAKLVVNGTVNSNGNGQPYTSFYKGMTGNNLPNNDDGRLNYSIYASGNVGASGYTAFSDARIKTVEKVSDATADLEILKQVEITDYTYRDFLEKGKRSQKKVIAQQVEEVFPQAVSRSTGVVPDIYQKGQVQGPWIELETDLKVGEKVRLIGARNEGVFEVLEVKDGKFRTAFEQSGENFVFVYGREVNDFRSVDYEAIAMLNVSATQELARRLEAKEKEVDELKARLDAMAARMISIENALSGGQLSVNSLSK